MHRDDFWNAMAEFGSSVLVAARLREASPAEVLDEAERYLFGLRGAASVAQALDSYESDVFDFPSLPTTAEFLEVIVDNVVEAHEIRRRIAQRSRDEGGVVAELRGPSWSPRDGLDLPHDTASVWELRAVLRAARQRVHGLVAIVVLAEAPPTEEDREVLRAAAADLAVRIHLIHLRSQQA